MLKNGYRFEVKEKKVYPPLPEDIYQVELLEIDLDSVPDKNNPGQFQDVLKFQFVVLDDGEYRGRSIWRNFVPTYIWKTNNEKNALYQITKAMIQRDMTEEEMASFSSDVINSLIGFQLRVGTVNKKGTGANADKTYTNIDKFLPKKTSLLGLTNEEKEKAKVKEKPTDVSDRAMGDESPAIGKEVPADTNSLEGETPVNISAVPF